MIQSSIKVHGIGAMKIIGNVNTNAPDSVACGNIFHPVLCFACVLMQTAELLLLHLLLWPLYLERGVYFIFIFIFFERGRYKAVSDCLAQVTGLCSVKEGFCLPMRAVAGLEEVSGLRR